MHVQEYDFLHGIAVSLFVYSCFLLLWAAFRILVNASGHKWSGRDVVFGFVKPFQRSFTQWRKSCEIRSQCWQIYVLVDIPIIINSLFLRGLWICISWPGDIKKIQSNRIWSFLGTCNWTSRFNMMTISEILSELLREPKKKPCWFLRHLFDSSGWNSSLSPWDSPLIFSLLTMDSRLRLCSWNL